MFNSEFLFNDSDTTPNPDSSIQPNDSVLTTRCLLDTLIEKYREEHGSDSDVDLSDLRDAKSLKDEDEKHQKPVQFTDIIRDKKAFQKKSKTDENDKFFFRHAVDKFREVSSFLDLRLSKPLLKAITVMALDKPMPIQCACIPIALLNHDICACARTGSGKTLAFLLPIMERLAKKPFSTGTRTVTRALVVSPTRELAVQIFKVAEQLVQHCPKIRIQLAAGGLELLSQEASLRQNPDLVIATPGRLIDHLTNAPSFNLQNVEYLVLDEADKLLNEYFMEQIGEIIRHCGKERQTLLFSATMTESVKELAILSLKDPVQIFLNQATAVATRLQQEFVRIRPHREQDRTAILVSLLVRNFRRRTIVFLPTKKQCHRMHITLRLLGLSCAELHGDLTQTQRLDALSRFSTNCLPSTAAEDLSQDQSETGKAERVEILLATDLAARGLDIPDLQTVINYTVPQTMQQYVHRVGRTARATKVGRAISLVCEGDRKLLKEIMKEAPYPIKARVIAQEVITRFREKLVKLNPKVDEILNAETEERELRIAQSQLERAERFANAPITDVAEPKKRIDWFANRKRLARRTMQDNASKNNTRSKIGGKKRKFDDDSD